MIVCNSQGSQLKVDAGFKAAMIQELSMLKKSKKGYLLATLPDDFENLMKIKKESRLL